MFGLGFGEIIVIFIVALLVFGPERMPQIAKTVGRSAAQFRRALDEFKREINLPSSIDLKRELLDDRPLGGVQIAERKKEATQSSSVPQDPTIKPDSSPENS